MRIRFRFPGTLSSNRPCPFQQPPRKLAVAFVCRLGFEPAPLDQRAHLTRAPCSACTINWTPSPPRTSAPGQNVLQRARCRARNHKIARFIWDFDDDAARPSPSIGPASATSWFGYGVHAVNGAHEAANCYCPWLMTPPSPRHAAPALPP